ncbi:zinc finger, C2H2 type [Opisthorchis viverrini]|uniref:Zinc finger, C2H2 type n=1 Tax=Opisthorchis viverrini TaxID=6198 RepID=A0A1S8WWL5_OPIVI|nr:zinc finger, C2H2 type [Opisthorchis viverrini]
MFHSIVPDNLCVKSVARCSGISAVYKENITHPRAEFEIKYCAVNVRRRNCFCSARVEGFLNCGAIHKHKSPQHLKVPMEKEMRRECAVCKRWCDHSRKSNPHFVDHTEQRPFVCVLCAKAYSQLETLQRHHHLNHLA